MKKASIIIALLLGLFIVGAPQQALAADDFDTACCEDREVPLVPLNVQYAEMIPGLQTKIDFDWIGGHKKGHNTNYVTVPFIDMRYTFKERFRIGTNFEVVYGDAKGDSSWGFPYLGLTLEGKVINGLTAYFNQQFPLGNNSNLGEDVYGRSRNGYSFQTGGLLQFPVPLLSKYGFTYFGDLGYNFTAVNHGRPKVQSSFVYQNAFVWDTNTYVNPMLELTGISNYSDSGRGTDLRIIPGVITPILSNDYQLKVGFPIGLNNPHSPEFGVQTQLFMALFN